MISSAPFPYRLYLVLSEADCAGRCFLKVAEQAILGGVDLVQLREKTDPQEVLFQKALQVKEITDKYRIPLIINDHLEIARQVDAFGIHLGNHDLPPSAVRSSWNPSKCIGYSLESLDQLSNDRTALADYLGISPVFRTSTKTDTVTEWGLEGVRKIRKLTPKPLVAIGNLNVHNIRSVIEAGADCIAVVSAICRADDPQAAAYALKKEILR